MLYLIGGLTDVCIHYTAVDAHQHDYYVKVVTDAVAGSSKEAHEYALKAIHYLQRDSLITVADVESDEIDVYKRQGNAEGLLFRKDWENLQCHNPA